MKFTCILEDVGLGSQDLVVIVLSSEFSLSEVWPSKVS